MNLVVDIGNTLIKAALFESDSIVWESKTNHQNFLKSVYPIFKEYQIKNILYSASGKVDQSIIEFFKENSNTFKFDHDTKLPFLNTYETPKTLGLDRLALVTAAYTIYPSKNVLVIDAGTCVTYDIITEKAEYLGGSISPGLVMRLKALNHYTEGLPLLSLSKAATSPIGKNTRDAILNGVINGTVYEIDQNIESYMSDFKDLTIILTGGDQHFLSTKLKNVIFANSKFQLLGLNSILEYLLND